MRVVFSSVKVSSPWGPAGPSEPQEGEAGPPEYRRSPLCSSTVSEALSIPSSSLRGAIDVPWGGLVTTAPPRTEWPQRSSCGAASTPSPPHCGGTGAGACWLPLLHSRWYPGCLLRDDVCETTARRQFGSKTTFKFDKHGISATALL